MNTKKPITIYLYSTIGVGAMFVILVAVYFITSFAKQRLDLTQERLYTLSQGTRAILKDLDTPVQIRFYCSQGSSTMPVMLKTYAQRIEDLLYEYKKASKNIEIKKFDPQPDSDAEDSANLDGIEGQMINTGEKIYLGIAVSCLDTKVPLPFMTPDREKLLEYDISRAISQAVRPEKPVVGVMSTLPVFGEMNPMMMQMNRGARQEAWVFISELKRDFNVKQVEMTADKIDDDIKVLLVVYPKDITDKAQFALDQFVLRGGKLIAFLDPLSLVDKGAGANNPMQRNLSSGASLDKLLKAWGIEFDKGKVLADKRFLSRINRGRGPEAMTTVLSLTREGVDTNDVVTSQIDNLFIPFSGTFSGTPVDGLKRTVLLRSTPDSQLVEKMMAEMAAEQVDRDFTASGKEQALAIRLTGKFKTAFPEGKPKDAPDAKDADKKEADKSAAADQTSLKESKSDGVVVLVADSDMIYDQFCAQVQNFFGQRIVIPQNQNLNFLQNVVEQMAGDSNLIGVRSRASMSRPFTVVKRLQAEADSRWQSKIKELEKRQADAQQKVNELQAKKEGDQQRFIVSPEQQQAIAKFRQDQVKISKELKGVRKDLKQEVDSLENRVKWINMAFMPIFVTLSGLTLAIYKRKKTAAK